VSDPVVRQNRRPVRTPDGSIQLEVTTYVVDAGDLPFVELFVATIADPLNPKTDALARVATPLEIRQADASSPLYVRVESTDITYLSGDSFARIANVNDVTALPRDRTVAVQQGTNTYLTSAVTKYYADVTTAIAAYRTFLTRLSELVEAWREASASFTTSPTTDYTLPTVATSVEDELTDAYVAARDARLAALAARDAAQVARDACVRDGTTARQLHAILAYDVAFLESAKTRVTAYAAADARTFALNASDAASYESLLVKKRSDLSAYLAAVRAQDETCLATDRTLRDAQASLDQAGRDETTALARVLEVCPTFNPSTV
jgi:hypothetical protein